MTVTSSHALTVKTTKTTFKNSKIKSGNTSGYISLIKIVITTAKNIPREHGVKDRVAEKVKDPHREKV